MIHRPYNKFTTSPNRKKCSDAVFWENYNIGSQNHAKITSLQQNYNKFTTSKFTTCIVIVIIKTAKYKYRRDEGNNKQASIK